MINSVFTEGSSELILNFDQIDFIQDCYEFENCWLDKYNPIINAGQELETIILKRDMQFFGRAFLFKINKSLKMIDDDYDKTFTYISVYGIFEVYTKGEGYKRFYDEKS